MKRAAVLYLVLGTLLGAMVGAVAGKAKAPRPEPKASVTYCIDPWASADLGTVIYGPCKTVNPLRVTKA